MSPKYLKFNIKSNDYFGTLAATLSLIRQNIKKDEFKELNIKTLKKVEKDLVSLQNNWTIIRKLIN